MGALSNVRVGARLAIGFGVLLTFLVGLTILEGTGIEGVRSGLEKVYKERTVPISQLAEINVRMLDNRVLAMKMLANQEPENVRRWSNDMQPNVARITQLWNEYMSVEKSPEEQRLAQEVESVRALYVQEGLHAVRQAAESGRLSSAQAVAQYTAQLDERANAVLSVMDRLMAMQTRVAEQAYMASEQSASQMSVMSWVATIITLGVGALFAWMIARSITVPLGQAVDIAHRIKSGDLSQEIVAQGRDEAAALIAALRDMQANLRSITSDIRTTVDQVSTASGQIATGNQDLSSRTEEQASSLQQTAASLEQLTSTVQQSADNAKQANQLAAGASEAAAKGGSVVDQVVATMEDISASSRKIADIIGVIDGIAFQTNILALNAAVEAARAGEQGRGFAVVAGEVRNLAQRSAQAAREIKTLISASVERVEAGSEQVAEAGATMHEIVSQVKQVSDLIGDITSATIEQSSGIGQVNDAISQMDQVTQQNAALVEQSAAAAASLNDQARHLAHVVSVFRLSQEQTLDAIRAARTQAPTVVGGTRSGATEINF